MGLYEEEEGDFDDEGEEAEEGAEPQVGFHACSHCYSCF